MNIRKVIIPLLVVVGASLAPPALAKHDDRAGASGPGAIAGQLSSVRPDDRAGARGARAYESAKLATTVRPDDRVGARGLGALTGALTTVVVQPGSTGFDWGDATIGSLGGIGIALTLTGALFLVIHRRRDARIA